MLNGMEQMVISMLQKMTGLTPEQMQGMIAEAMGTIASLNTRLTHMEEILMRLDANTPDLVSSALSIEDKTNAEKRADS